MKKALAGVLMSCLAIWWSGSAIAGDVSEADHRIFPSVIAPLRHELCRMGRRIPDLVQRDPDPGEPPRRSR